VVTDSRKKSESGTEEGHCGVQCVLSSRRACKVIVGCNVCCLAEGHAKFGIPQIVVDQVSRLNYDVVKREAFSTILY